MTSMGYVGIALLMFAENLFPPIPSELIMPLAGFTVAQGKMNLVLAVVAGLVGTMLGALPWYYAGKLLGEERLKSLADKYGKWITLSSRDIDKADNWFDRHGAKAVLFCRLVPGVRTLISLPAGLSEMSLVPFLIYSTIGSALWIFALTYAGYLLGDNYDRVDEYLGPVSKIVLVILLIWFALWVGKRMMRRKT
ncbi:MAG TPA: DedA family protein [Coleofasciculaceae cyanobacterium]